MKTLLMFLSLFSCSIAMPMQMPRMGGFGSKSEEVCVASPMAHLGPLYGYNIRLPQQFPQIQMPVWPQPPPNAWLPRIPSSHCQRSHQQHQSHLQSSPQKQYPPFGNGMFPFHQPPWHIPQVSECWLFNPYFGYFGYHGFGGRPPYYSEEMFEQDFEKPKEEDPPKVESTTAAPPTNSTVPETNSTQATVPVSGGSQGGNETSTTGNEAEVQNPGINLAPAVNVSGQDGPGSQVPPGPYQPTILENSPNPNLRGFPISRQWSQTSFPVGPRLMGPFYRNYPNQRSYQWPSLAYVSKQIVRPGNTAYQKVYPYISKSNSPNHVSNPANNRRKPQGPTKQPEEINGGLAGPKLGTAHKEEQIQNPKENSVTQRERITFPTRDPTSTWRNSQGYETNKSNYKLTPPQGSPSVPSVNSVDQPENYYPRVDSRRFPASIQASNFPKGIVSEPRKGPSDSEINPPEIKHGTHQTDEGPYPPKESFFLRSNTWNLQKGSPIFEDEPTKQEGSLLYPALGARENVPYPEYVPYDPQRSSLYARGNMWDEGDEFPGTFRPAGQPGNPLHSLNSPSGQRHRSTDNEEDPIDPTGDEFYRGPDAGGKESNFKGSQVRYRERYPYAPSHPSKPKEYPQHSTDNLERQRNPSYGEYYPWHFPPYNFAPPLTPPRENSGYYYPPNALEQEESTPSPSWGSWDQKNYVPAKKGRIPYYNRYFWDQATNLHKSAASALEQREHQPHSSSFPAGLRGSLTYQETENLNYDSVHNNRINTPEKGQFPVTDSVIQNNLIYQGEVYSYSPASQRSPCCAGESPGPRESPLISLDYSPPFGLVSGDDGERNPPTTEGIHMKHARHIIYSTDIQPNQRNSSEKNLSEKGANPDPFRADTAMLKKSSPCSKRSPAGQTESVPFSEADSLQANMPCRKSNLRGEGNNVLAKILGVNQFNARTSNLIPEELEAPEENLGPENIQSEGGGSEGRVKQKGVPNIQKVPCLHSKLKDHLLSSTGAPLGKRRPGLSTGEPAMVSAQPSSTLTGLTAREQLGGTNIDPLVASEPPLSFPSLSIPKNAEFQDCLLLHS
uniref:Enamelin n=1 Tax=Monodelphis domestica TaxID=13616 RepID=F7FNM5_MONDO